MDLWVTMSPGSRRTRRGREGFVLDNVTAAPYVTNDVEANRFSNDTCPDEMVIFNRGRRSIPLTFSPDIATMRHRLSMGSAIPARQTTTQNIVSRLLLPTRTSPRKRLTLSDSPPSHHIVSASTEVTKTEICQPHSTTPFSELAKWSPVTKKSHLDENYDESRDPSTALKGLTREQLLSLITDVMGARPDVSEEIRKRMPEPDLPHMENSLRYLKQNISRSLPNTRLESKSDSMAYNRVCTHLFAFKKTLLDQAKNLAEACAWKSVIDHMVMAWTYVKATPIWDNPTHNNVRKTCFKALASNCLLALKKGSWNSEFCQSLRIKLRPMEKDSDDVVACIKILDLVINNGNVPT